MTPITHAARGASVAAPSRGGRHLDALLHAVGTALRDLLARLRDGAQHGGVLERGLGDDGGGLFLEGDLVAADA